MFGAQVLHYDRAAVVAELVSQRPRKYVVRREKGVVMIKAGTSMIPLKENEKIISGDGEILAPTGQYFRTGETIDPFHLITDYF
jgi:hypothetical protein